ncbi:hypothetical protein D3C84_315350 [compost metagenome]
MTRNKYLMKSLNHNSSEKLKYAVDFPSHILKKGSMINIPWNECGKWILDQGIYNQYKNDKKVHYELNKAVNIFHDTKRMASSVGRQFSTSWSYEKMQSKHEEFTHLTMLKKYSPKPFEHLEDFKVNNVESGEYVAELCSSPLSVREEGEAMHHCVGGYTDYVAENKYLVYSVKKDGKRSSTLGIWVEGDNYRFSQHYGPCNARLTDPDEIAISHLILGQLNV